MIHAYNPAGRALCGKARVPVPVQPATQALYRDLCHSCLREVTQLCRRLAP